MFSFFDLVVGLSVLLIILFTALSYATGLFYLAEWAEEYPTATKQLIQYCIYLFNAIYILLYLFTSNITILTVLIGLLTNYCYYRLSVKQFPDIRYNSYLFYSTIIMLLINQFNWIYYFRNNNMSANQYYYQYQQQQQQYSQYNSNNNNNNGSNNSNMIFYTIPQQLSFYLLVVWLIPLIYFITASVGDFQLPTSSPTNADNNTNNNANNANNDTIDPQSKLKSTKKSNNNRSNNNNNNNSKWNLMALFRICGRKQSKTLQEQINNDTSHNNNNSNIDNSNNSNSNSNNNTPLLQPRPMYNNELYNSLPSFNLLSRSQSAHLPAEIHHSDNNSSSNTESGLPLFTSQMRQR